MNPLYIDKTDDSPKVVFDPDKDLFILEGMSMPEETTRFYSVLINWLTNYSKSPNSFTKFIFKIYYYNSSSSIEFVKILKILDKINKTDNKVKVIWYYNSLDETIIEDGEEFKKYFDLEIELKPLN